MSYILNESRKVVGYFSKKVNDQNADIVTIYLSEIYNSGMNPVMINHLIIIKNFDKEYSIFIKEETETDCFCEFTE